MKHTATFYGKLLVSLLALTNCVSTVPSVEARPYQTPFIQSSSGDQPMISHIASGGLAGDLIMISGRQLQTVTAVLFNGVAVKPTQVDPKGFFIQVKVPNQATTGPITLLTSTSRLPTNATFRVLTPNSPDPERQKILDSDREPGGYNPLPNLYPPSAGQRHRPDWPLREAQSAG